MNIILISNTCSDAEFHRLQELKSSNKYSPQQNFFSMLIDGLLADPSNSILGLTTRAVASENCSLEGLPAKEEILSDRLKFIYHTVKTSSLKRNVCNYREMNKLAKKCCRKFSPADTVVLADPLVVDSSMAALPRFCRMGFRIIAIVTDIPMYITAIEKGKSSWSSNLKSMIRQKIYDRMMGCADGFCFLTEAMNLINKRNVPYTIVEGMVPAGQTSGIWDTSSEVKNKIVMYAGGLYEKFGIKNLVDAAKSLNIPGFELHLYGEGTCVPYIQKTEKEYPWIRYCGVVPTEKIKEAEKKAGFLINPRPADEEFTQYSFPSKTLEYMSSGRPVITTRLAGIPYEYFGYVYTIKNSAPDGIAETLKSCLNMPEEEATEMGAKGCLFALEQKSADRQAKKIMDLIGRLHEQ